jgi:hypothetical protein
LEKGEIKEEEKNEKRNEVAISFTAATSPKQNKLIVPDQKQWPIRSSKYQEALYQVIGPLHEADKLKKAIFNSTDARVVLKNV